jgi:exodeoxyribonuclease VII large subunit
MKPSGSQWDFGELFPPAQSRKVLSVTELTAKVKRLLEQQVGTVWVTGEVTNLRVQNSGHMYFTLKDAGAQLSCVLFRGEKIAHRELLQDGQKLLLLGEVTVYEARGQYQLIVHDVELQGVGALQLAFEKLKQQLQSEGLFAPERKRPLPRYPERIGLVTSPTGAAIRDVLHVVRRRNPALEILLVPCRVQGEGAAQEIAAAIRLLNECARENERCEIDLILVTRGGGSLEDLWAFNEEMVARAIFESQAPVVSAVGHEIDFTISDFVADVRAATPSAAAEIITEGAFASREFLARARIRLRQTIGRRFTDASAGLSRTRERLARAHPRRRMDQWLQRLDDLLADLVRRAKQAVRQERGAWRHLAERLLRVRPTRLVQQSRERVQERAIRLGELARRQLGRCEDRFKATLDRLRLLGPEQVLARGYSITTDASSGRVVLNAAEVSPGQRLRTRLAKGEIISQAIKAP